MRGNPAPSTTDHEYSLVEGGRRLRGLGLDTLVEIRRVNHCGQEAEQGTAFDEGLRRRVAPLRWPST
jgi:hypothetical protein